MNLSELVYPIYRLREEEPQRQGGVLFYFYEKARETFDSIEHYFVLKIIDDTNLNGESLATRRLQIRNNGDIPYRLNRAIFFLGDFIKIATPKMWFIDSSGKIFRYSKQTRAKLSYRKVTKVIPIKTGGVIVEVEGLSSRMKALFVPRIPRNDLHAGVLLMGMAPILYGFYDQKYKDTWRMI